MRASRLADGGEAGIRAGGPLGEGQQIEIQPKAADTANALIDALFETPPSLEADLHELAAGF